MSTYTHVVLFSFRANVTEKARDEAFHLLKNLGKECGGENAGILDWRVDWNLDTRKNVHIVEIAQFRDEAAFLVFKNHPAHKKAGEFLRDVSDWQVGDIPGY
ncbi:MAG: Dabb family protein [Minisyncoccia bacterium]